MCTVVVFTRRRTRRPDVHLLRSVGEPEARFASNAATKTNSRKPEPHVSLTKSTFNNHRYLLAPLKGSSHERSPIDQLVRRRLRIHRDWRNDVEGLGALFAKYIPDYGNLISSYADHADQGKA